MLQITYNVQGGSHERWIRDQEDFPGAKHRGVSVARRHRPIRREHDMSSYFFSPVYREILGDLLFHLGNKFPLNVNNNSRNQGLPLSTY